MRTTLTLDDDVAARLDVLRQGGRSLKEVINDTLRAGLDQMDRQRQSEPPYRITTFHLGRKMPNLDNIAEVLAGGEAEDWR
jgi:hypothetical protein